MGRDGAVEVDAGPPAPFEAPRLLAPVDGASSFMPHPHFSWEEVAEADHYSIQIARDRGFSALEDEDAIAMDRYVHLQPLAPGRYWWRVAAADEQGWRGPWTAPHQLEISAPVQVKGQEDAILPSFFSLGNNFPNKAKDRGLVT